MTMDVPAYSVVGDNSARVIKRNDLVKAYKNIHINQDNHRHHHTLS